MQTEEIVVRSLTGKDLPAPDKLVQEVYRELSRKAREFVDEKLVRSWFTLSSGSRRSVSAVAMDKRQIIGLSYALRQKDNGYHIDVLWVKKGYRRAGIGTELLRYLVDKVKMRHAKKIELNVNIKNKKAYNLYKKFGFNRIGLKDGWYWLEM